MTIYIAIPKPGWSVEQLRELSDKLDTDRYHYAADLVRAVALAADTDHHRILSFAQGGTLALPHRVTMVTQADAEWPT